MIDLRWTCKSFNELSALEMYKILQLRNEVFVVEQQCIFQDADDKDESCFHLCGWHNDLLAAYSRIVPPNVTYKEMSIGRVVTSPSFRRNGSGKILLQKSIEKCIELFGNNNIKIGAQLYLKKFYMQAGFEQISDVYLEDGIEHIYMMRKAK